MSSLNILQNIFPGSIFLSVGKAATALDVTEQALRNEISKKSISLKTVKRGGRRLIYIADLAQYIDSLAENSTGPRKRGRPRKSPKMISGGGL